MLKSLQSLFAQQLQVDAECVSFYLGVHEYFVNEHRDRIALETASFVLVFDAEI